MDKRPISRFSNYKTTWKIHKENAMILVWEITVRQTFSSGSFTRALVGIPSWLWMYQPTHCWLTQLVLKDKLESDGLLSLFNSVCVCVCCTIYFTWSGNFKNYGYQTSAGWYCSKYAQPSPVRNLLWPNTQLAPCPCLLHFLFCNPEQGLWDRVADILFYWSTFCFVCFCFFSDRDSPSSPGWPWLSIFSLRCPSARITGMWNYTCLYQLALASYAT